MDKLKESLALLMLTYVDLCVRHALPPVKKCNILRMYLMHSPGSPGPGRADSWAGMQAPLLFLRVIELELSNIYCAGLRGAGLGTQYRREQLRRRPSPGERLVLLLNCSLIPSKALKEYATIIPAVNQIELSPWRNCAEIVAQCKAMGTLMQAYSPLTKGQKLSDEQLAAVAAKYSRTPAQILIRYGIDQVTLPN